jgi:hypothetical protein
MGGYSCRHSSEATSSATIKSPVNNPHPIAIEWVFGGLKYSDLQDFAVFGRFSCDLGARLREGGSAWAAVLIQCAGLFHGADNAPQATCP